MGKVKKKREAGSGKREAPATAKQLEAKLAELQQGRVWEMAGRVWDLEEEFEVAVVAIPQVRRGANVMMVGISAEPACVPFEVIGRKRGEKPRPEGARAGKTTRPGA